MMNYEVGELLFENEFHSVHNAINTDTGRKVWLYTIQSEIPDLMEYSKLLAQPTVSKVFECDTGIIATEPMKMSLDQMHNSKTTEWANSKGRIVYWNYTKKLIFAIGVAEALKQLHKNDLVYGALIPEHIYLDADMHPKLGNLHFCSKELHHKETPLRKEFRAPELSTGDAKVYKKDQDVYSYAMIMYSVFLGEIPYASWYSSIPDWKVLHKIMHGDRPKIPAYLPRAMKHLLEMCWASSPDSRATMEAVCNYFKEHLDEFVDSGTDVPELNEYIESLGYLPVSKYRREITLRVDSIRLYKGKNEETAEDVWIYDSQLGEQNDYMLNYRKQVCHPAIMKVIACGKTSYVTEAATTNTLRKVIEEKKMPWKLTDKLICAIGVAEGLKCLHKNGLRYPGINPDSIIMDNNMYPKIGNLHCVYKQKDLDELKDFPAEQDSHFLAPEIYDSYRYHERSDIYAYGMLLYYMFTEEDPFPMKGFSNYLKIGQMVKDGARPTVPSTIPKPLKDIMERCWHPRLAWRPSADEICTFFAETVGQLVNSKTDTRKLSEYMKMVAKAGNAPVLPDDMCFSEFIVDLNEYERTRRDVYTKDGCSYDVKYLTDQEAFEQQITTLKDLSHRCIIKLCGCVLPTEYTDSKFVILTEHVPGTLLSSVMEAKPEWLDGTAKAIILSGVALGMAHVHSMNHMHGNLNTENIVIDDAKHYPHIREFASIGLASDVSEEDDKTDVYSFGVLMYEVITGQNPFADKKKQKPEKLVKTKALTPAAQQLISQCWSKKSSDRPSFTEICSLFKSYIYKYVSDVDIATFSAFVSSVN